LNHSEYIKSALKIICAFILFSSCAYYNTFYNAEKIFKAAEKERESRSDDLIKASEKRKYTDASEKAYKIIEFHTRSKYVDDALFMLGQCMFHKKEFIPAKRKFEELTTYFPNSELYPEGKLWLARTNLSLNNKAASIVILENLIKDQSVRAKIRAEGYFELGGIALAGEDFETAEKHFLSAFNTVKNKKIRSRSSFSLAKSQLLAQKNEEALSSFKVAIKHASNLNEEFEARLFYSRALKQIGDLKNATNICNQLLENELFNQHFGRVKLELADILYLENQRDLEGVGLDDPIFQSKINEALEKYEIVLLQHKKTDVSAAAYYRIAKIYEQDLRDFAKAQENYQKVKLEKPKSEYATPAELRAKNIADLIRLSNQVREAQGLQLMEEGDDSKRLTGVEVLLLEHGVHPELRLMKALKLQKIENPDSTISSADREADEAEKRKQLVASKLQLAETYLFQFQQIDSAWTEYKQIVELFGDHPASVKALFTCAYMQENIYNNRFKTDSLLYEVIRKYPHSEQAVKAKEKLGLDYSGAEPAEALYKFAEDALFAEKNYDKAIRNYSNIVSTYPESEYAANSLYAIGWIHEKINFDNARAAEVYKKVVDDYPDFELRTKLSVMLDMLNAPKTTESENAKESIESEIAVVSVENEGNEESIREIETQKRKIVTFDRRPKILERGRVEN